MFMSAQSYKIFLVSYNFDKSRAILSAIILLNFYISLEKREKCFICATGRPIFSKFYTITQNMSLKCMTVKSFNFQNFPKIENINFYDDAERVSQACRQSAILDCRNWIFNERCTWDTCFVPSCQILCRQIILLQRRRSFSRFSS